MKSKKIQGEVLKNSQVTEYKFKGIKQVKVRKAAFISSLMIALYNIKFACKQVGIGRRTYYKWRAQDPEFLRACEEIDEGIKDDAEYYLQQAISAKDTKALMFYLKTKGRDRGYIEKKETEMSGSMETSSLMPGKIIIMTPNEKDVETEKSVCDDKKEDKKVSK